MRDALQRASTDLLARVEYLLHVPFKNGLLFSQYAVTAGSVFLDSLVRAADSSKNLLCELDPQGMLTDLTNNGSRVISLDRFSRLVACLDYMAIRNMCTLRQASMMP